MSGPTNEDLQRQIDALRAGHEYLEREITHVRERAEVKYADHNGRLENLENVRIGFFGVIAALLFMNLGGIGLIIYLQTLP